MFKNMSVKGIKIITEKVINKITINSFENMTDKCLKI